MILEQAVLDVVPGREEAFERDFDRAAPLLRRQRGYLGHRLLRCQERPARYLLLVEWEGLEDHTVGFREGPDYPRWKELLHHYYEPFPTVEHYAPREGRE